MNTNPEYHIIKLSERAYWNPNIQAQTKEIFGVYAFDRSTATHCCELTPSYCLMYLGADFVPNDDLSDEEREALDTNITEGSCSSDPVIYMHVRDVENLMTIHPDRVQKANLDFDLDEDLDEQGKWNAEFDQLLEGWSTGSLMF